MHETAGVNSFAISRARLLTHGRDLSKRFCPTHPGTFHRLIEYSGLADDETAFFLIGGRGKAIREIIRERPAVLHRLHWLNRGKNRRSTTC